ncbi:MAG: response regulator, partial [bacterium]|nr:response regulator [bacterium]
MTQVNLFAVHNSTDFLDAPGEMAELIRSIDWAQTPLGPPATWPQSLRTALSICLHSHFPILLWWGPELVMLYNDAYRPMLGNSKHPAAMGRRGREAWDDVWHIIGPMLEGVMQEGKATWSENRMLPLDRYGYVEECYFTFSYSPISDETGGIGGVFCAVTETTQQIISARRLIILNDLAAHAGAAGTQPQVLSLAADTLTLHPTDLPFGLIYRFNADNHSAVLEAAVNIQVGSDLSPKQIDLSAGDQAWPLAALLGTPQKPYLLLEHLGNAYDLLPGGTWPEHPSQVLILPIHQEQQQNIFGFFVAGISPRLAFDKAYHSFLHLVADQLSSALSRAAAYEYERKRAESLAEIDRAKTDFFANVSHEFRTPLTLMLASLEDAFVLPHPFLAGEDLHILHRNALRLLKLVNTLLDFSRIEADRIKASYRPVDLAALTIDLASMFRSAIEKAGLSFNIYCPPLAEPVYVDTDMWEKIVLNLLSNAFKFTFEGGIEVALQQAGKVVELAVLDTGTGIAAEELPHLFTRFHRIKQARSRSHEGSGIGNALVKELVDRHGGTITVESRVDEGSTFLVRIPLGKQHLPQDQVEQESSPPSLSTTIQSANASNAYIEEALRWLPNNLIEGSVWEDSISTAHGVPFRCPEKATDTSKKILVVDDNTDMRRYLVKLLRPCWQVEAVANGADALQAAMAHPPDLVLTDIMMPVMDGLELIAHLREHEKTRGIPIIIISARAGEEAYIEGVDTGADDYIIKPFSPKELLAKIGTNLQLIQIRQDADRKIIENEKRLRAYIQTSSEAVYQMSADWQEMRQLIGNDFVVDTAQPSSTWIDTYLHPEDHSRMWASIQKAIRKKQLFKLEHRVIRPDGSLGWAHSRAVPILDDKGSIIEWIGTASDITERKKAEQELQKKSAKIITILEKIPVGFVVLDHNGNITMRNSIMNQYVGKTMPSIDPRASVRISFFDPQGNTISPEFWPGPQALRGISTYGLEGCFRDDDDRLQWHLISAVPVRANDGKIAGAIVVVQDISQQKITEQELRRINDHLDALVQARTAAAERKTEQLRSLTAQLVEVEENERRNFAALLHDDLQQIIGAAQVQIQTLVRTLPDAPLLADVDRL